MTSFNDSNLQALLDPKSIAIIGASDNPDKIGGRPIRYLKQFGYRGKVYPINPNRAEIQGIATCPHVDDLSDAPEVAIIAVAGHGAVEAVRQCAVRGVRAAVIMSSGFGETNDIDAKNNELTMVATAREHGMRLIGPNSQGLANFGNGAILSFSTMFLETTPCDGPVGIISQSGAMSVVPYGLLRQRGIGVRYTHATGNDADVTTLELATAVVQDPALRVLLLYLEGIPDPEHLLATARIAAERNLPIIALKSGRTPAGQRAARSHTGALANEDRVVDAFLERCGIWRARDVQDMVRAVELHLKGWKPSGRKLVAISNSGAVCVLTADAASMAGMPLATLAEDTRGALGRILPSFATTSNPVDITAALLTNSSLFGQILPVIARDPAADAFLIGVPVAGKGYDVPAFARDAAEFARETGKPLVCAIPQPGVAAQFKEHGLPVYATESEAIAALNQYLMHVERMTAAYPRLLSGDCVRPPASGKGEHANGSKERLLNEADGLEMGARFGIRSVPYRLCGSVEEALKAFRSLGGPVAIKGCSAEIAHKSELGIVCLGVVTEEAVRQAYADIERKIADADNHFDGVIVARMFKGQRELMIGAHIDPTFGPVVMVGDGGKYVEAMPDTQILLLPVSEQDVRQALSRLRIAPLFGGVRDEPPLDSEAVVQAVLGLGRMMADNQARVISADFNPIIVGPAGKGYAAVDALLVVSEASSATHA
jgi:acyl-CoA synthetase (NDP forming)